MSAHDLREFRTAEEFQQSVSTHGLFCYHAHLLPSIDTAMALNSDPFAHSFIHRMFPLCLQV